MSEEAVSVSGQRAWKQDKINAYMTLYTALVTVCKAAAPMIPFMTEEIYQQSWFVRVDHEGSGKHSSVRFPGSGRSAYRQEAGSLNMDEVLKVVVLGRACTQHGKHQEPSADCKDVCESAGTHCRSIYAAIIQR